MKNTAGAAVRRHSVKVATSFCTEAVAKVRAMVGHRAMMLARQWLRCYATIGRS